MSEPTCISWAADLFVRVLAKLKDHVTNNGANVVCNRNVVCRFSLSLSSLYTILVSFKVENIQDYRIYKGTFDVISSKHET